MLKIGEITETAQSQTVEQQELLEEPFIDVTINASTLEARNRFCRLCLRKCSGFLLPLATKLELVSVMEMLLDVTGLEIEGNPLYPTKACTDCMNKLDYAYAVRQEFLNSTELLLKMAVENRLPAYYSQFDDDGDLKGEDKRDFKAEVVMPTIVDQMEEVRAQSDSNLEIISEIQHNVVPNNTDDVQADVLQAETKPEPELTGEKSPEPKKEKFVYSWKELIKPKRVRKERPKNALSGINRKEKADAELLAQFPQTTCYICDTPHETLDQRDEHLNSHIDMVPHRCETCSSESECVVSKSVLTLNRHRLMHRLPHKCDFCFRRFISSGSKYTHVWSMHMGNNEGLTCDFCGKGFNQKRSFQAHVRRHRYKANGRYSCNVCGETCGSSLLLARHKRKHTGEKNFACPYCSKTFSRACNMLTHKRIHTDERCHRCSECGATFRNNVTLRKHRDRFHLGKTLPQKADRNPFVILDDGRKQFTCQQDDCSYTAFSSASISRHKARHSKRYACGVCGKRFAEPNLVRRHQTSIHRDSKTRRNEAAERNTATAKNEERQLSTTALVDDDEIAEALLKLEPDYEVEIVDEADNTVELVYGHL
ncbi:zinc finger protein 354A-like [Sabethes cyaneus]|uniref:zinc finger protein 354A-like n=1 Tax=Sabethes cyaneus TaxID=53552 RepID=UPI00237DD0CF|nr:zinc finger protein 354A-like [Sabethes cyaneus]